MTKERQIYDRCRVDYYRAKDAMERLLGQVDPQAKHIRDEEYAIRQLRIALLNLVDMIEALQALGKERSVVVSCDSPPAVRKEVSDLRQA